ncbi:MAG: ATP-binding cassette domain-containing protein [Defluviitaleaceae bacterium]|nr:ATP-binding cassette domain-containing protein [Defluviitaleaceae bacterium]
MENNIQEKKPLISIRNLKQYFPIKGARNVFLKANDGISLEIYEGETLGIVGESGCGKSTLGRTLLQLYTQTDGESIYYGRSLDEIMPDYALDIFKNLEKRCADSKQSITKAESIDQEYKKIEAELGTTTDKARRKTLYAKRAERDEVMKKATSDFLVIVRLVGGFYVADNYAEVSSLLMEYHKIAVQIRTLNDRIMDTTLIVDEMKYKLDNDQKGASQQAYDQSKAKLDSLAGPEMNRHKEDLQKIQEKLDAIRAKRKGDAEFEKYEAYRDDGIDLARLKYKEMRYLRKDLQLIFQDPYSSLNPRLTVGQIVSEGPITHKYFSGEGERMQEYSVQLMESCGLAPYMIHRYPHQFSGGQRQRIGIARALSVKPKFVVCDEAVSALDVSIQSQIINLLQNLKEQYNLTYMFISHDLSVIKYISNRVAVMYLGHIVELADSAELFENPLHPYTEALLSAIPTTDVDGEKKEMIILEGDIPSPVNPPQGCKFNTRCRYASDICHELTPDFKEIKPGHFVACHRYDEQEAVNA